MERMAVLSFDETLTLMMALTAEHPLETREIAQGLDCSREHAYYVAHGLRTAGALVKPRYGCWAITEKGRIACAMAMYHAPDLRTAFFD
jgi:hypothetical protein